MFENRRSGNTDPLTLHDHAAFRMNHGETRDNISDFIAHLPAILGCPNISSGLCDSPGNSIELFRGLRKLFNISIMGWYHGYQQALGLIAAQGALHAGDHSDA